MMLPGGRNLRKCKKHQSNLAPILRMPFPAPAVQLYSSLDEGHRLQPDRPPPTGNCSREGVDRPLSRVFELLKTVHACGLWRQRSQR
jgi:hypothetical protein